MAACDARRFLKDLCTYNHGNPRTAYLWTPGPGITNDLKFKLNVQVDETIGKIL